MPTKKPKQWSILDSEGKHADLIPEGSSFSLRGLKVGGKVACYRLHVAKKMHRCFHGRLFYPVGVEDVPVNRLPAWEDDPGTRSKYMKTAMAAKVLGRRKVAAARFEGTFTARGKKGIARIYHFKNVRDGDVRDWIVFDLGFPKDTAPEPASPEPLTTAAAEEDGDGTGHGDG